MAWVEIGIEEARELLLEENPPRLIDVRDPDEFAFCRIEGAMNLPLSSLDAFTPSKAGDPGETVLVICHHGIRSQHAARFLDRLGYRDVRSILGGIDAWAVAFDPDMPRY